MLLLLIVSPFGWAFRQTNSQIDIDGKAIVVVDAVVAIILAGTAAAAAV